MNEIIFIPSNTKLQEELKEKKMKKKKNKKRRRRRRQPKWKKKRNFETFYHMPDAIELLNIEISLRKDNLFHLCRFLLIKTHKKSSTTIKCEEANPGD